MQARWSLKELIASEMRFIMDNRCISVNWKGFEGTVRDHPIIFRKVEVPASFSVRVTSDVLKLWNQESFVSFRKEFLSKTSQLTFHLNGKFNTSTFFQFLKELLYETRCMKKLTVVQQCKASKDHKYYEITSDKLEELIIFSSKMKLQKNGLPPMMKDLEGSLLNFTNMKRLCLNSLTFEKNMEGLMCQQETVSCLTCFSMFSNAKFALKTLDLVDDMFFQHYAQWNGSHTPFGVEWKMLLAGQFPLLQSLTISFQDFKALLNQKKFDLLYKIPHVTVEKLPNTPVFFSIVNWYVTSQFPNTNFHLNTGNYTLLDEDNKYTLGLLQNVFDNKDKMRDQGFDLSKLVDIVTNPENVNSLQFLQYLERGVEFYSTQVDRWIIAMNKTCCLLLDRIEQYRALVNDENDKLVRRSKALVYDVEWYSNHTNSIEVNRSKVIQIQDEMNGLMKEMDERVVEMGFPKLIIHYDEFESSEFVYHKRVNQ